MTKHKSINTKDDKTRNGLAVFTAGMIVAVFTFFIQFIGLGDKRKRKEPDAEDQHHDKMK